MDACSRINWTVEKKILQIVMKIRQCCDLSAVGVYVHAVAKREQRSRTPGMSNRDVSMLSTETCLVMHDYMHTHAQAYTHTHTHALTHARTHTHACTHAHTHIHTILIYFTEHRYREY